MLYIALRRKEEHAPHDRLIDETWSVIAIRIAVEFPVHAYELQDKKTA
jgi:nuclear transport factor 2 (NTF2) superfamily protein